MDPETYLDNARREFQRSKDLSEGAIAQLDDEQLFVALAEEDNSIAVLMKHMAGNMLSRWRDFLTTDGEKPERNRDGEFVITATDTAEHLRRFWDSGWKCLIEALEPLEEEDLDRTVFIRGEPHTVRQAINRQLTHYAYHAGQIVQLAKVQVGDDWKTLSIAKGESASFNEAPAAYLDDGK